VTPERHLTLTLDFCLRVGEVLLSSGAGASDVTATMLSISRVYDASDADVDVTFTSLTMTHQADTESLPTIATRQVQQRVIDYADLTRVDHLVRAVLRGELELMDARAQLRRIVSTGHDRRRWAVTGGWGVMCAGVAVQLGGDAVVTLIAAFAAVVIDRLQLGIARRRIPFFYQQVAGGLVATLIAVGSSASPLAVDVSLVVTANIVMLLAGVGFMGAIQDALTGFYITAGARITEAFLSTAGIIAGVSGGLSVGTAFGVEIPAFAPGQSGFQGLTIMAGGAAVAAAGFAWSTYSPIRVLVPVALLAAVAMAVSESVRGPGIARSWSVAVAALVVGLVGFWLSSRLKVPPLVVVVSAVVPLLPGISIYRGLSLVAEGGRRDTSQGLVALATAASVALALAAGVILGEYLAQPLKREAARLESRLSGPRLVGPVQVLSKSAARRLRRHSGGTGPIPLPDLAQGSGSSPGPAGATASAASAASHPADVVASKGAEPERTEVSTAAHVDRASSTRSSE